MLPTQTIVNREYPPEELLAPCPFTPNPFEITEDLVKNYLSQAIALQLCNADKKALRVWAGIEDE